MSEQDHIVIPLTRGLITWISPEDADIANWNWVAKQAGSKKFPAYYAMCTYNMGGSYVEYYLHDLVWTRMMDTELPEGFLVDHVNGDKLDNRRINLRLATKSQNEQNKRKRRADTSSKYKGVVKVNDGREKCWRATLTVEGKNKHIGTFYNEIDAALAYNKAAYKEFGEFALLNEVTEAVPTEQVEPIPVVGKKPHGRPRKDPSTTVHESRKTGRSVGRPRKHPKYTQHQLRRKTIREQARLEDEGGTDGRNQ